MKKNPLQSTKEQKERRELHQDTKSIKSSKLHSFSCLATHTRNSSEKVNKGGKCLIMCTKRKKWSSTKEEKERHYQRNVCSKKCEIKWGLLKRKGNEKKKGHLLLQ